MIQRIEDESFELENNRSRKGNSFILQPILIKMIVFLAIFGIASGLDVNLIPECKVLSNESSEDIFSLKCEPEHFYRYNVKSIPPLAAVIWHLVFDPG